MFLAWLQARFCLVLAVLKSMSSWYWKIGSLAAGFLRLHISCWDQAYLGGLILKGLLPSECYLVSELLVWRPYPEGLTPCWMLSKNVLCVHVKCGGSVYSSSSVRVLVLWPELLHALVVQGLFWGLILIRAYTMPSVLGLWLLTSIRLETPVWLEMLIVTYGFDPPWPTDIRLHWPPLLLLSSIPDS